MNQHEADQFLDTPGDIEESLKQLLWFSGYVPEDFSPEERRALTGALRHGFLEVTDTFKEPVHELYRFWREQMGLPRVFVFPAQKGNYMLNVHTARTADLARMIETAKAFAFSVTSVDLGNDSFCGTVPVCDYAKAARLLAGFGWFNRVAHLARRDWP